MIKQTTFAPVDISSLMNYSNKLSISQVIFFFERQGVDITRTMVQNYVRVGILPPLVGKRYYSKKHIVFLALVYILKDTYSLEELKNMFAYLAAEQFDDNVMQTLYERYIQLYKVTEVGLQGLIEHTQVEVKSNITTLPYKSLDEGDISGIQMFLSYLLIGSIGAVAKNIVKGENHGLER